MRKVLVIGGSYFAGRVFVEELVKEPDVAVYVFNRGRRPLGIPEVRELIGDREDRRQLTAAIPREDWDAVVDFCAYEPAHIEPVMASLTGLSQYLLVSTTTVYEKSSELPIEEDAPKLAARQVDLGPAADYGYDKWRSECEVVAQCEQRGWPYTCLRPAIIYGYYNYVRRETYFFDLLRERRPMVIPAEPSALFSFIWVVDMAKLIIRCLGDERTYNQAFNLASDELVSYPRIVGVLEKTVGRSIDAPRVPVATIESEGIPLPFPVEEHLVYSGAKIQRLFGFEYTPFELGIRESLRYYVALRRSQEAGATQTERPGSGGE